MAHFAKINANGVVEYVTPIDNSIITDENGVEQESLGVQHIHNTIPDSENYTWKQCSINASFRNIYPGEGHYYIEHLDSFVGPKPFDSWILNEDNLQWVSPIGPKPELTPEQESSGYYYGWIESTKEWYLFDPLPEITIEDRIAGKDYIYDFDKKEWVLTTMQ